MAAYVIVDVQIDDPVEYEDYKARTPQSIHAYGGRFIVRGGKTETLEGDWEPGRIVVLEFPTFERAREWWECEMYTEAKAIRQRTARTRMILVDGATSG